MGTEQVITRFWTASNTCIIVLREGVAYVRYNDGQDNFLETNRRLTIDCGVSIAIATGCTIDVEDLAE